MPATCIGTIVVTTVTELVSPGFYLLRQYLSGHECNIYGRDTWSPVFFSDFPSVDGDICFMDVVSER